MTDIWTLEETDPDSGRQIFARAVPTSPKGLYGTYAFSIERDFQVRTNDGEILLQTNGSAKGEYWCGVFLFFVADAAGTQVRLDESDTPKDKILNVPDAPLPRDQIWT